MGTFDQIVKIILEKFLKTCKPSFVSLCILAASSGNIRRGLLIYLKP